MNIIQFKRNVCAKKIQNNWRKYYSNKYYYNNNNKRVKNAKSQVSGLKNAGNKNDNNNNNNNYNNAHSMINIQLKRGIEQAHEKSLRRHEKLQFNLNESENDNNSNNNDNNNSFDQNELSLNVLKLAQLQSRVKNEALKKLKQLKDSQKGLSNDMEMMDYNNTTIHNQSNILSPMKALPNNNNTMNNYNINQNGIAINLDMKLNELRKQYEEMNEFNKLNLIIDDRRRQLKDISSLYSELKELPSLDEVRQSMETTGTHTFFVNHIKPTNDSINNNNNNNINSQSLERSVNDHISVNEAIKQTDNRWNVVISAIHSENGAFNLLNNQYIDIDKDSQPSLPAKNFTPEKCSKVSWKVSSIDKKVLNLNNRDYLEQQKDESVSAHWITYAASGSKYQPVQAAAGVAAIDGNAANMGYFQTEFQSSSSKKVESDEDDGDVGPSEHREKLSQDRAEHLRELKSIKKSMRINVKELLDNVCNEFILQHHRDEIMKEVGENYLKSCDKIYHDYWKEFETMKNKRRARNYALFHLRHENSIYESNATKIQSIYRMYRNRKGFASLLKQSRIKSALQNLVNEILSNSNENDSEHGVKVDSLFTAFNKLNNDNNNNNNKRVANSSKISNNSSKSTNRGNVSKPALSSHSSTSSKVVAMESKTNVSIKKQHQHQSQHQSSLPSEYDQYQARVDSLVHDTSFYESDAMKSILGDNNINDISKDEGHKRPMTSLYNRQFDEKDDISFHSDAKISLANDKSRSAIKSVKGDSTPIISHNNSNNNNINISGVTSGKKASPPSPIAPVSTPPRRRVENTSNKNNNTNNNNKNDVSIYISPYDDDDDNLTELDGSPGAPGVIVGSSHRGGTAAEGFNDGYISSPSQSGQLFSQLNSNDNNNNNIYELSQSNEPLTNFTNNNNSNKNKNNNNNNVNNQQGSASGDLSLLEDTLSKVMSLAKRGDLGPRGRTRDNACYVLATLGSKGHLDKIHKSGSVCFLSNVVKLIRPRAVYSYLRDMAVILNGNPLNHTPNPKNQQQGGLVPWMSPEDLSLIGTTLMWECDLTGMSLMTSYKGGKGGAAPVSGRDQDENLQFASLQFSLLTQFLSASMSPLTSSNRIPMDDQILLLLEELNFYYFSLDTTDIVDTRMSALYELMSEVKGAMVYRSQANRTTVRGLIRDNLTRILNRNNGKIKSNSSDNNNFVSHVNRDLFIQLIQSICSRQLNSLELGLIDMSDVSFLLSSVNGVESHLVPGESPSVPLESLVEYFSRSLDFRSLQIKIQTYCSLVPSYSSQMITLISDCLSTNPNSPNSVKVLHDLIDNIWTQVQLPWLKQDLISLGFMMLHREQGDVRAAIRDLKRVVNGDLLSLAFN